MVNARMVGPLRKRLASAGDFLVFTRHGWRPAADGISVRFPGFDQFGFFSHFIDGGYRVSEASTGLALVSKAGVAGTYLTRGTAIGAALAWLSRRSPKELQASIDRVLAKRGGERG